MNAPSMQDAFQHHLAFKIKDFADSVETNGNGCFTRHLEENNDKSQKCNWTGALFLGLLPTLTGPNGPTPSQNSNNERVVLTIAGGGTEGETSFPLVQNRLVLWRSQGKEARVKIVDGNGGNDPIFQLFFFNTHNYNYIGRDFYLVLDRLRSYKISRAVLTPAKCAEYIATAETWATEKNGGSWTTKRHLQYPTTDIPVSNLAFHDELVGVVKTRVFAELASHYLFPTEQMQLLDFFIVKYDAKAQSQLDWHRDVSLLSFNLALNDDFQGKGSRPPR